MGRIWSRFLMIIGAKTSKALDRAENPNETLDYSYEQMLDHLVDVNRGVADLATAKKRLELQLEGIEGNASKLEDQARTALKAGREDLATEALKRKSFALSQTDNLKSQIEELDGQQQKLVEGKKNTEMKIEAFRTEKEVIKAKYSAAKAQVKIGEAATGLNEGMAQTGRAIQRARDRTEQMTARANAIEELTTAGALEDFTSSSSALDRELAQLSQSSQVDDDLARLKAEIGPAPAKPELESAK